MKRYQGSSSSIACPECDIGPFKRNHYFTGKLLVERDFTDEQRYYIDKLRHHHQRLHGKGVVCGLKITQHEQEDCRDRYVCLEPGTAIDCCGREIVVLEGECIDITRFESVKALFEAAEADNGAAETHSLQICIRYKECPTEAVPVLYDECGCDETQCAPNRILESWELDVKVVSPEAEETEESSDEDCCERLWNSLDACPGCDSGDCIVLATIDEYSPGDRFVDADSDATSDIARIDNRKDRSLLPSNQTLAEIVKCLCEQKPSNGSGTGSQGPQGDPGPPGPGLESGLTRIRALSWEHGGFDTKLADIETDDGQSQKGIVIAFTDLIRADQVDAEHIFQVLLPHTIGDDELSLTCRCVMPGSVTPVGELEEDDRIITKAKQRASPAPAVAFIPEEKYLDQFLKAREHWVVLRGDFVIDTKDPPRAIDAEFVRGQLPTGDRPADSGYGVQGGLFESWFSVHAPPGVDRRININDATLEDLDTLPDIGPRIARRIIEGRPYRSVDDLIRVDGISEAILAGIRNLIRIN